MVIATIVAIFVFVIGDAVMSRYNSSRAASQSGSSDAGAVAVQWDGGKLTNQQLNELVLRRHILNNFLRQVQIEGMRSSYEAGVEAPQLRVIPLNGPDTSAQGIEQSVVETKILAQAAEDAGMKVSDETLLQYLDNLGRRNVTREQMRQLLGRNQSGRASIDFVMEALREEMLARNYLMSQAYAFQTITPQQRWKDWLLVNDRVVVEAAAVPVESFMADVKDPSESELAAFFDQYKDREVRPEGVEGVALPSPTPGFKIPRKIDVQFVEAVYDDFLTKAEAAVSDAEISKYYDANKKLFVKADTGLMEDKGGKKDTSQPEAPKTNPNAKPGENPFAIPQANKDSKPAPPTPPKDAKPAPSEEKKPSPPTDGKKSSDATNPAQKVFRLTAFEQKDDKNAPSKSPSSNTKPSDKEPAADESKKSSESSSAKTSPASPAPGATSPAPTPPKNTPAAPASDKPAAPPKPVEYQPLSEVKDQIRRQLAEGTVATQLAKLVGDLQNQLESDYNRWFNDRVSAEADKQPSPPPPKSLSDLGPVAAKNGLKLGKTGPLSDLQMSESPIGKSSITDSNANLTNTLFYSREMDLYQPKITVDLDGNRYVVMKTSDTPARVPKLEEVRAEVIKAWKRQKAAELALKRAEELAKKAQEAKSSLKNFFADDKSMKVVTTDPFSELTGGDVSLVGGQIQEKPYRLSQPSEIVAAGPGFMQRVFSLKDGQVVAVLNHDHSIAYIMRVVEHQPPASELKNTYLAEANSWFGERQMDQRRVMEAQNSFLLSLMNRLNLKWNRMPDRPTKGESAETDEG